MIIVRLTGGLGNQMFQYAAARRLAHVNKSELKLDLSWFDHIPVGATCRRYELDAFDCTKEIATEKEVKSLRGVDPEKLPKCVKGYFKSTSLFTKKSCVREKQYHFEPEILQKRGDLYLDGCWQSEKYFRDAEDLIRSDFKFTAEPTAANERMADLVGNCEAVSIHVRRGDYVTDKATHLYHGVSSLAYYKSAMSKITTRVANPHFFVFSDEPSWVMENLTSKTPMTFVDHNGPDKGYEDLRLMSLCKHHIIANSSFSWWGAWLNPSPRKIVLAPSAWFGSGGPNSSDVVPDRWERI